MPQPQYVTLTEARERGFGSERDLRRKISSGELPAYRIGSAANARSLRIKLSDLEKLLHPITPSGAS